jgi:hypothetical protein
MFVLQLHKLCKQRKLYNWLNIVNIFKKKIDFSFEKQQKLSVQPNIIKKNAEALMDASKEIDLEVNSEKTNYWVEQKVFAFFKWKVNLFKIYLQYLINYIISIACIIYVMARRTSKWLKKRQYSLCLRHLFENAKTFRSTQYNLTIYSLSYDRIIK